MATGATRTTWIYDDGTAYSVEFTEDKHRQLTAVSVTREDGSPFDGTTVLRRIPYATLLNGVRRERLDIAIPTGTQWQDVQGNTWTAQGDGIVLSVPPKRTRRKMTADWSKQVADVYLKAMAEGLNNPTEIVELEFGVSYTTAARWVSIARNEHGLIPKTTKGKARGR